MSGLKCKSAVAAVVVMTFVAAPSAVKAQGAVVGTLVGGALGGLAGSAIGHGAGQAAAIVAGVAIGSAVGGSVGAHADYAAGRPPIGHYPPGGYYHYPPTSGVPVYPSAAGVYPASDGWEPPSGHYVGGEADDPPYDRAPAGTPVPYGYYRK